MALEERANAIGLVVLPTSYGKWQIFYHGDCLGLFPSRRAVSKWLNGAEAMHRIMSSEIAALKARVEGLEAQALKIVVEEQPHNYNPWEKITRT